VLAATIKTNTDTFDPSSLDLTLKFHNPVLITQAKPLQQLTGNLPNAKFPTT